MPLAWEACREAAALLSAFAAAAGTAGNVAPLTFCLWQ
jgi:hypothetical protein